MATIIEKGLIFSLFGRAAPSFHDTFFLSCTLLGAASSPGIGRSEHGDDVDAGKYLREEHRRGRGAGDVLPTFRGLPGAIPR